MWVGCEQCDNEAISPVVQGMGYCADCWDFDELQYTRCFTFAVVYDHNGHKLAIGKSEVQKGCAERNALWRLPLDAICTPKMIVVARLRRNRNGHLSFGNSKPCKQCIQAFSFYNVTRVCYSTDKSTFVWKDPCTLTNSYASYSQVIVKL